VEQRGADVGQHQVEQRRPHRPRAVGVHEADRHAVERGVAARAAERLGIHVDAEDPARPP
jgi:hypothetical protein